MRYKPQVRARKSKRRTRSPGDAIREVNSRITISMLLGKPAPTTCTCITTTHEYKLPPHFLAERSRQLLPEIVHKSWSRRGWLAIITCVCVCIKKNQTEQVNRDLRTPAMPAFINVAQGYGKIPGALIYQIKWISIHSNGWIRDALNELAISVSLLNV